LAGGPNRCEPKARVTFFVADLATCGHHPVVARREAG
jgi:hypothetical protein